MLEFWHLASLDAPTVAVIWAVAVARSANIHLELWVLCLIASGTWTVYVLDRLLDARHAIAAQSTDILRERHFFHWRHKRVLLPIAAGTAALAAVLVSRVMPVTSRRHDSLIGAAALAYFSGVHASARFPVWLRRLFTKELLVGAIFACGCTAPTFTRLNSTSPTWPMYVVLLFFAALAWLNCASIDGWESQSARVNVSWVALIISFSGLTAAAILEPRAASVSALLCSGALSAVLLFALNRLRNRTAPLTLRAFADLVLLMPALLLAPGVFGR